MKPIAALLVVGLACLVTRPSVGQETSVEDYVKFMKPLAGVWTTVTENDGKSVPGIMSYELASNERCFLAHYQGDLPNVQTVEGYDPATKRHTVVGFGADGTYAVATVDWGTYLRPGKLLGQGVTGKQKLQLLTSDGKTITETATVKCTLLEPNKFVLEYVDRTSNGEQVSDMKITSTRKTSAHAPSLLKEYAALVIGEWECKAAVPWGAAPGDKAVPARANCCWAIDGAALEMQIQIGGDKVRAIACWDPVSGQIREFGVGSKGTYLELTVAKEGDKWVNRATVTLADGQRIKIENRTTFSADGDTHVNEYATYRDVFTRVKK